MKNLKILFICLITFCSLSSEGQWRKIELPDTGRAVDVETIDPRRIQIAEEDIFIEVDDLYRSTHYYLYTPDLGITWDTLFLDNNKDTICTFYSRDVIYANVGVSGVPRSWRRSNDRGLSWDTINLSRSATISKFLSDTSLIAQNYNYIFYSGNQGVNWDTLSWRNSGVPNSGLLIINSIITSRDSLILLVKTNDNYYLQKTNNAGISWDTTRFPVFSSFHHFELINDSVCLVTIDDTLIRTSNFGETWDTVFVVDDGYIGSLSHFENHVMMICSFANHQDSLVAVSHDYGKTFSWSKFTYVPKNIYYAQSFYGKPGEFGVLRFWSNDIAVYDRRYPKSNFLGKDTTKCYEYSIDLGEFNYADSIKWNDGDTSWNRNISVSGSYWAAIFRDSTIVSDTIQIEIVGESLRISDTTFCDVGSINLQSGFSSYTINSVNYISNPNFTNSGIYYVAATDSNGCSTIDTFEVIIFTNPTIEITDTSQCEGSVLLDAGDFSEYKWSNTDTARMSTFDVSDEYSLTVTDSNGCSASDTFEVAIFTNPTISITDTSQCAGSITIQSSAFTNYAWSTGSMQQMETFVSSGAYYLAVRDSNGCESIDSFAVDIYALPVVTLIDTFICPTNSIQINAGSFDSYAWSTGATSSSITTNVAGDYSVVVTDTNGCTASDTATIGGYPATVFTLGPDTALCADSIALNVATLKPLATSYTWSSGDTSDVVVFNQSGAYWLEVTDTNGCYGRDTINLTLNAAPIAPMISRVGDTLHTTSSLTHQWYKDGVAISGQADSTLPNITAGSYQVIVIDGNGCKSDTSNLLIYTAGVSRLLADGMIRAYPNPSRGGVSLECNGIPQSKVNSIRLVSTLGQEIPIQTIWSGNTAKLTWDIAPQAVWLIVHTENGTFRTQIIER